MCENFAYARPILRVYVEHIEKFRCFESALQIAQLAKLNHFQMIIFLRNVVFVYTQILVYNMVSSQQPSRKLRRCRAIARRLLLLFFIFNARGRSNGIGGEQKKKYSERKRDYDLIYV